MAAELFTPPSRVLDSNADPYAGALAYFYASGTSTPQSVYTTSALSVAHTNPVVADSAGKLAPIYMDPSLSYRVVIKNSTGSVTLHDIDPVNPGILGLLAASGGSALFGFLQAGTGAIARTGQSKLRDRVDAFDFIPVAKHGDIVAGTNTDDLATYLQAALNTGKIVRLPEIGTMWIATSLLVPSGGGIVGGGFRSIIKAKANFGNYPLIRNYTDNPQTLGARDSGLIFEHFLIDGNKANNATATEFSHCIHLLGVDGAWLNVATLNPKGDGVLISYSRDFEGVGTIQPSVGCSNINGFIRSDSAARMGVAITCCEGFNLWVEAIDAALFGFDIEPDSSTSYVRNGFARISATGCGAGTGFTGGVSTTGTAADGISKADVCNNEIHFAIDDCDGDCGLSIRDVTNCTYYGTIRNQTGHGVYCVGSQVAASRIRLAVAVDTVTGSGLLSAGSGNQIRGWIDVVSAAGHGVNLQTANECDLEVRAYGSTSNGLLLEDTTNSTFRANIAASGSDNVWCRLTSTGNRFPGLVSTGSVAGWGFLESNSSNDNRATNARMSGNSSGNASLVGATTLIERETLFAKATYDPASIATDVETAIQTITVTGAALGDEARVTFSNSLAGAGLHAWVSAANTVSYYLSNIAGANPLDLASGTIRAYVTPRTIA